MESLTSIVAVNQDGAIGCQNQLPWRLKTDLKFFRQQTSGNTVIMGRKTYDSIGGCLPNRTNIVLSHNSVLFESSPTCQLSLSIAEAIFSAAKLQSSAVFVVGGASTYAQFAPYVDRYLITVVDKKIADADAFLSEDIFGDINNWDKRSLAVYPATPGVDEASFEIFEWTARDAEQRRAARAALLADFKSKALIARRRTTAKRAVGSGISLELQF
jgi:dihydrofolate reductase